MRQIRLKCFVYVGQENEMYLCPRTFRKSLCLSPNKLYRGYVVLQQPHLEHLYVSQPKLAQEPLNC